MDETKIQVKFKKVKDGFEYQDALYFTEAEYDALKESEIEDMKQARFDAWLDMVKNPPAPVEPTKEELQAIEADLQKQLDDVKLRISEKE